MWDKSIDDGIFLCEHNSHILTKKFLQSLVYVKTQLKLHVWQEPSEFLLSETDLIAYILWRHSEDIQYATLFLEDNVKLTNEQTNAIFQTSIDNTQIWDFNRKFFIEKLFARGTKFDSVCVRCNSFFDLDEIDCSFCKENDYLNDYYEESESSSSSTVITCNTCEGHRFYFNCRPVTHYCEFDEKTLSRTENNCKECDEHFDNLEKRLKGEY